MERDDADFLQSVTGLFVGMLTPEETKRFNRLCNEGKAYRAYEGAAGFMGLAKCRQTKEPRP